MRTYRLTFDIDLPDEVSEDDIEELQGWLDHFIYTVEDDIYSCNSLDCDIDVSSNYEEI